MKKGIGKKPWARTNRGRSVELEMRTRSFVCDLFRPPPLQPHHLDQVHCRRRRRSTPRYDSEAWPVTLSWDQRCCDVVDNESRAVFVIRGAASALRRKPRAARPTRETTRSYVLRLPVARVRGCASGRGPGPLGPRPTRTPPALQLNIAENWTGDICRSFSAAAVIVSRSLRSSCVHPVI